MKHTPLSLALAASAFGGDLNIVQLGPPNAVTMTIACGEAKQNVDLPHGGSTGLFALPEKPAVISHTGDDKIPSLKISATTKTNIAILSSCKKGFCWTLIPGQRTEEKWSMRAINLAASPARLTTDDGALVILPSATQIFSTDRLCVRFEGGENFIYDGREPCAMIAIIYQKDDAWKVLFVPDR